MAENTATLAAASAVSTVFDSVMRKLDNAAISNNASPVPTSPKVENAAKKEKYSRTTALLLRAQQLEAQLKQKSLASRPNNMEGGFSSIEGHGVVGNAPTYTNNWEDNDDQDVTDIYNNSSKLSEEENKEVEQTILQAEQAKKNVRRYKKEAHARRQRRLMMESAEADALKAKIKEDELRRQRQMQGHQEDRIKALHDRLDKQRRKREERNRRRAELFAAEKRIREMKPKPLHKRMVEQYRHTVELPELQRRKKRLAEIHNHFTKNSPDISELDMRQRAHVALQRLSGERDHHKRKGKERTWMETRVWYHGQAKSRVLKEDQDVKTAAQTKHMQLKMQLERKKAYAQWVKKIAPPQLDADKVSEMQSRVERLRNPAPKKTQRDRKPRRKRDHNDQETNNSEQETVVDNNNDARGKNMTMRADNNVRRNQRPPAPTTAVREALSSPSISNRASPTGLSHPEDLSERAAQLAARARELRNSVEVANSDTLDDNFQHAKLQNMYLASMQTTLDAIANTK
jgi:hypothetical protein